ncbi:hypothetical protein BDP81DRAFT_425673 [Colletotrichum phormii]|uniref:WW domain-containing protein n=1 Tax=Colletotrichum phormii TaxID=359342 RepID=A0AAJ0EG55_9PEZI|nr:uncharacterized protein BDP81DRAFT_425673 [Colletotrichum phormii]KAK1637674.1 hypothetical protein BDP81DRAFT_425673 [Colletotrichum phormii]
MAALPTGWEWDYDGSRWLYRYRPNGHEQFHFPKEGDEFPDFVDCFSPAPELAPEEKLESQQQLKRRTTADANPTSQMRATGGPMSDFGMSRSGFGGPMGNDDDDSDGFFFQPENFMYLGPGAYDDISPEADEDEREEALGKPGVGEGGRGSSNKNHARLDVASIKSGVSPLQSETNTPSIINSVPVRGAEAVSEAPAEMVLAEQPLNINTDTSPDPNQTLPPSPGVPLLDSVEKPRPGYSASFQRPPWDPVGTMAEMATEHTAPAHIETHPDPVEMADTAVLAPIETNFADLGIAELPERSSPAETRPQPPTQSTHDLLHQTNMSDAALYGATFGTGSRPQNSSPSRKSQVSQESRRDSATGITTPDHSLPEVVPQPAPQPTQGPSPGAGGSGSFTIKRKPSKSAGKQTQYQPYVPGVVSSAPSEQSSTTDYKRREHRNSLARDGSLMMGPRTKFHQTSMPSVLRPPQLPPKVPIDSSQAPSPPASDQRALNSASQTSGLVTQGPLQHFPSVLKPARGQPQNRAQEPSPPQPASADIPSKKEKGKEVQYAAFQPGLASQKGLRPQGPDVQRPETTPIQSSQDQYRMLSQNDPLPATNTPPAPAFLQRPRAQSDIRQQPLSNSQHRASIDCPLDGTQRHDSIPDGGRPRQTSYASSEVSSLGPPTGSQSSVPLQTQSPLESEGRRHSSGFFHGGNSNSYSSQSGAGFGTAGLRTASISGPSPALTAMETARQAYKPAESQVPPARPGKVPVSTVAMPHPDQVMESQTFGETWTPSSNRRHSLPSSSMADQVALPVSQQLQPERYELSDQSQGQVQPHFDSVHWETSGTSAAEAAHDISRPFSVHPTGMQPGQSGGLPSGPKPPITSQPSYPTEENRQSGKLASRPSRPTVTLPSQNALGPMSPCTPIRSPGHLLHPIHEHNEIYNVMNTASATSGAGDPSDARGYMYASGPSPHFSSASNPAHYPVANNHPSHQSPANIAGLPQSSRLRPGSTPPVMQHSANGKEKGGWLSKFKKGGSSKSTVLQKAPPPQQGIPIQQPLQPAPPPQGLMTRNPMTAGVPTDQRAGEQATPVMSRQPNNVPNVQYTPFAPPRNSASSDSHAVAQNTGSIQQAPIRQNLLAQSNASLVAGPMPQPTSQAQQQYGVGEQVQQRSASVPPGNLALPSGSPMDQIDNLSDTASVSTMDVSEAQAQPVLRPQLVTVERHVAVQPNREQPAVQSASHTAQSAGPNAEGRPDQALGDSELVVQPLFSKSQTRTTVSAVPVNQAPVSQNKWAQKPAVDYSGDDWGDDPWDYQ